MRLILHIDRQGLIQVELVALPQEQTDARQFFCQLRPHLEALERILTTLGDRISDGNERGSQ